MKVSFLYRTASVLLLLWAAGHTIGFRQIDPAWHVDSLVDSMKSVHFDANGSIRNGRGYDRQGTRDADRHCTGRHLRRRALIARLGCEAVFSNRRGSAGDRAITCKCQTGRQSPTRDRVRDGS